MRRAAEPESLRGLVSNRDREDTLKLDKTHTKFVFFKASPDESTVDVVYSFLAGTMRCRTPRRDSMRRKTRQNLYKIPFFRGTPRREA